MPRFTKRTCTPCNSLRLLEVSAIQELFDFGLSRTVPSEVKSAWRNPTTASRGAVSTEAGTSFADESTALTPSFSKKSTKNRE